MLNQMPAESFRLGVTVCAFNHLRLLLIPLGAAGLVSFSAACSSPSNPTEVVDIGGDEAEELVDPDTDYSVGDSSEEPGVDSDGGGGDDAADDVDDSGESNPEDTSEDGSGEQSGDTSEDGAAEPDCPSGRDFNACGGCEEFAPSQRPGRSCGRCGNGTWLCDEVDPEVISCEGDTLNACNGCNNLHNTAEPGDPCGSCGSGAWICDGSQRLVCYGGDNNECGGCAELTASVGDSCGVCGVYACDPDDDDALVCVDEVNACGGCAALVDDPGDSCGDCDDGYLECDEDDPDVLACVGASVLNSCGGCEELEHNEGDSCGACGDGVFVCDAEDEDSLNCVGASELNACGGCGVLLNPPLESCGDCGVWVCSEDNSDTYCDDLGWNPCGGCEPLPDYAEPCGDCGAYECDPDNENALACVEYYNSCGSCAPLEFEPGDVCGDCYDGVYECSEGIIGEVVCVGATSFNSCGACSTLANQPGDSCGECGSWVCDEGGSSTSCIDPGRNVCGGCEPLPDFNTACGDCGVYACDPSDDDALICLEGPNACGSCGPLDHVPGTECGPCADGLYQCGEQHPNEVICVGATATNTCGGCTPLDNEPGGSCGTCGEWACAPDNNSTYCDDPGLNSCGVCGELEGEPGARCGSCGTWGCAVDGKSVICSGEHPENSCGGCGDLDNELGAPCGICNNGSYECVLSDEDKNSTACVDVDEPNICGGCGDIEHEPGTSCGTCGVGVWECSEDNSELVCEGDLTNACGGCLSLSDAPGDSCDSCSADECNLVCTSANDLTCVNALSRGFVRIAPGTFLMGSPENERGRSTNGDETQRQTTLTRAFYMATVPVTQGKWFELMGNNPSCFTYGYIIDCVFGGTIYPDRPVETVNWWDAISYANALSQSEGLPACYTLEGCTGTAGDNLLCTDVTVNTPDGNPYDCSGYRLPTEAEWEYAARAGTTTATYDGNLSTREDCYETAPMAIAWYCGNGNDRVMPVGIKRANGWGLYDMLGNVYEWVWDWYGGQYGGTVTDPYPRLMGTHRVYRGGSYSALAKSVRAASRNSAIPQNKGRNRGFRLVRTAP